MMNYHDRPIIDVDQKQWSIVNAILQTNIPEYDVWAFGSRVTRSARRYSDLDLVIVSETKINAKTMVTIRNDFEESLLPWTVDILDWSQISEEFRQQISKQYVIIQRGVMC